MNSVFITSSERLIGTTRVRKISFEINLNFNGNGEHFWRKKKNTKVINWILRGVCPPLSFSVSSSSSFLFSVQEEKAMQAVPTAPIDASKFVAYVQERRKKRILFKGEYLVSFLLFWGVLVLKVQKCKGIHCTDKESLIQSAKKFKLFSKMIKFVSNFASYRSYWDI